LECEGKKQLILFQEALEKSTLPFLVDVVDFDTVNENFKKQVFKEKILWL